MILEIARLAIKPGSAPEFEAAVAAAHPIFAAAQGFLGMELRRIVEQPDAYVLLIRWATLEDHTVVFRQGPGFQQWRALASPYFGAPPAVEHAAPL
jgi:heme-degrading monooxygenase HmoA